MSEKFKLCFMLTLVLYLFASTFCSVIYYLHGMAQGNSYLVTISTAAIGINLFIAVVSLWWDGFIEAFKRRLFASIVCALIFAGVCGCMLFESIRILSTPSTDFYFTLKAMGLAATTMILMALIISSVTHK